MFRYVQKTSILFVTLFFGAISHAKIIYNFDFEKGDTSEWSAGPNNIFTDHAVNIVTNPARTGKYAAKFNLKKTDQPPSGKKHRAELYIRPTGGQDEERWFGFSSFLPANYEKDDAPEVIAQWHADPDEGEMERSPNVELRIKKDQVQIYKVWDDNAKSVESTPNQTLLLEFPLKELKGKWTDWVFHIHWDFNKDGKGLLEVWKNKEKILTHNGPMGCNDTKPTYFKWGIYKWKWTDDPATSQVSERTIFMDSFKMGDENSSLEEVSPDLHLKPKVVVEKKTKKK